MSDEDWGEDDEYCPECGEELDDCICPTNDPLEGKP